MEEDKKKDIGVLVIRLVLGLIFFVGALNMIMGFYNAPTLDFFTKTLEANGVMYPGIVAMVCLVSFGIIGILLILGIFIRFGSILGILESVFIIIFLQWKNGLSVYVGGMEYSLLVLSNLILLLLTGAGRYSLSKGK